MANFPIFDSPYLIAPPGHTLLRSNRGMCSNWNALVAAAETKNKLLLWMKSALFSTGKVISMRAGAVKS